MIIPKPHGLHVTDGVFTLGATTTIGAPPVFAAVASWLRRELGPVTGLPLQPPPHDLGTISFLPSDGLPPEGYRLVVGLDKVVIEASEPAGAFYAAQTLLQLLPADLYRTARISEGPWHIPCVTIEDQPRFGWRGLLLDVARHFQPKREILRHLDLMALHKLNVLHLHLTDDQGWRLEIKRHPRLTEVGSWRAESMIGPWQHGRTDGRPHGGYYTQDDIREIVAYAAERHITVIPEIDLPGHAQAAIAAYPRLGNLGRPVDVAVKWGPSEHVINADDSTLEFFEQVLEEVLDLFPSEVVCLGGDECVKTEWRSSPRAQSRIHALGLPDETALQSWIIGRLAGWLSLRGRRTYGWDEILDGGAPSGAIIAAWHGHEATTAAIRAGHDVVATPFETLYFDFRQAPGDTEPIPFGCVTTDADVYAYDPIPSDLPVEEHPRILGAQAAMWTEMTDSARTLDYLLYPRLATFAEVVWSSGDRDFAEYAERLESHLERLDAYGVEYRRGNGPLPWQQRPDAKGWPQEKADIWADVHAAKMAQ